MFVLKYFNQEKGSSLLGAVIVMVILGLAGASVVSMVGVDLQKSANFRHSIQCEMVNNAGIVYARNELTNGRNPAVSNKSFGSGEFTVESVPNTGLVTVKSWVNEAYREHSLNVDFGGNCLSISAPDLHVPNQGVHLMQIHLTKTCNKKIVLDKMTLTWNIHPDALAITCGNPPCLATEQNIVDLDAAPVDVGIFKVEKIQLQGHILFKTQGVENEPAGSGEEMDLDNDWAYLDDGQTYAIKTDIQEDIPDYSWFWLNIKFQDLSEINFGPFQVKNSGA